MVMISDRLYDMEGAVANGVRGIGVLGGFGDREELEAAGAWKVVAEPADIATVTAAVMTD